MSLEQPIRVVITDDQAIVRRGIRALLATESDIDVLAEAASGEDAIELIRQLEPDVALMDLVMPGMGGVEAIRAITALGLSTAIVVLTSFAADDDIFPAIKAGALGYLLKDSEPEDLIRAIRQVHRGEPSLHPAIARRVLLQLTQPPAAPEVPITRTEDLLTARELDVLNLIAGGLSNKGIAEQLVVSETTVRTHVSSILRKLHLASRTQAALYALREGYTPAVPLDPAQSS